MQDLEMNQGDDKLIRLFYNNSLRWILNIRWQGHMKTVELHQLSAKVWQRWKFIKYILRWESNNCNLPLTCTPKGKGKRKRLRTTWQRTMQKDKEAICWWSWGEAWPVVEDRAEWRCSVKALCARSRQVDR